MKIKEILYTILAISIILLCTLIFLNSVSRNNFTIYGLVNDITHNLSSLTKLILNIVFVAIVLLIYLKLLNKIGRHFNWWQKDKYGK